MCRVANELGAGDGRAASQAANHSVALTACIVSMLSCLLIIFRYVPEHRAVTYIRHPMSHLGADLFMQCQHTRHVFLLVHAGLTYCSHWQCMLDSLKPWRGATCLTGCNAPLPTNSQNMYWVTAGPLGAQLGAAISSTLVGLISCLVSQGAMEQAIL